MTHSLYLSIIGAVVFLAAYIILRLLRNNERLILELEEAKADARTLDADLDQARRNNRLANAYIEKLNAQLDVLGKRLSKYNKEAKVWKIRLDALEAEHRKTVQQLYGRIGAMQRNINRHEQTQKERLNLIRFLSIERCVKKRVDKNGVICDYEKRSTPRWMDLTTRTKSELKVLIKDNGLDGIVDIDLLKLD